MPSTSKTTRFSLVIWNDGSAPFTRLQMRDNMNQIETLAAKFRTGATGERGAANSSDNAKSFFYDTSVERLYFSTGDNWVAISGAVLPGDLDSTVAGAGLSLDSTTGLEVVVDGGTLEIDANELKVRNGGISSAQLRSAGGDEAVVRSTIRNDAINEDKIADNSIRREHILNGEVIAGKLASNAVVLANMTDNSVDTAEIVARAVTGAKIATGANGILAENIHTGQVIEEKIGTGAVTQDKIGTGAVTEGKIDAGAVTEGKIGTGAVTEGKIDAGAVTEGKIDAGAVTANKIGDNAVSPTKVLGVSGIAKGGLVTASESNTFTTLPVGTNGQYLIAASGETSGLMWATLGVTQSQMTFNTPTAYTPTWGGPAGINLGTAGAGGQDKTACTLEGYYLTVGSLVWVHVRLLIGDATDISKGSNDTPWTFLLPVLPVATRPQIIPGYIHNADLTDRKPVTGLIRPNVGNGDVIGQIATPSGAAVFRSSPYSWTAGAQLVLEGWYQKA